MTRPSAGLSPKTRLEMADNWFAYVGNNPMSRIDPNGLEEKYVGSSLMHVPDIPKMKPASMGDLKRLESNTDKIESGAKAWAVRNPAPVAKANSGMLIDDKGKSGSNDLGEYTEGSMKMGVDTSPGNANLIASSTVFEEEQNHSVNVGPGTLAVGSSQTAGSAEAFIGLKDGRSVGLGSTATVGSLEGNVQASLLGYGLKFYASANLGLGSELKLGSKSEFTFNAILGFTLGVETVTPSGKP